ncbi:T9SS type A sorting domain-containing protein [Psychroflexus halocasei]|uniref:Por secretion system C-terminal sorting domain-containing protein n=1 Tax=Psychroflexus halocasei TaxID=908615 RepID=A0A1H4B4V4_9FLAO|nr:T9SS type A sorting domain-containing protein [Psychroflexus halocasei]SEA43139.1 Por secretion system C-terminal sorting domain-containing protein [Psychroflexus halocasei]
MKTFFKIFIFLLSLNSLAQVTPLEDHTWYLEKLVIDGQTVLSPAPNSEINEITAIFENGGFETTVCNTYWATFEYSEISNSFYAVTATSTLGSCNNTINQQFENDYTQQVFIFNQPPLENHVYTYWFDQQGSDIILTIESAIGNQAVYRNNYLSLYKPIEIEINLYPNPVKDNFQLEGEHKDEIKSVKILTMGGKEVLSFQERQSIYDISQLLSGIYFVRLESDRGELIRKIIKK